MAANIDISDIQITNCHDGKDRHLLDSADKIIRWIKYGLSQQEKIANEKNWTLDLEINLSNCVLYTKSKEPIEDSTFSLLEVIKEAKREACSFFDCDGYDHISSKRFVKYPLKCDNCIFYWGVFQKTTFHERVTFENTVFVKAGFFSGCEFLKYSSFKNAEFLLSPNFDNSNFDFVIFDKAQFDVSIGVNFTGSNFNYVSFCDIKFDNTSGGANYNIAFQGCEFNGNATFKNVNFISECHFENAVFDICEFENCNFSLYCVFDDVHIKRQLIFLKYNQNEQGNVISEASFTGAVIDGRLEFIRAKISKFDSRFITVNKNAIIRYGGSCVENLNLRNMLNNGIVLLQENNGNVNVDFASSANFGVIEVINTNLIIANRSTARLLKDFAYRSNNVVEAMMYKSIEMDLYHKELSERTKTIISKIVEKYPLNLIRIFFTLLVIIPSTLIIFAIGMYLCTFVGSIIALIFIWTPLGGWIKKMYNWITPLFDLLREIPIAERVLLWLNTVSNKNGQSWWRGFKFTIITAAIFFTLINYVGIASENKFFIIDWKFCGFGEVWQQYLNMFYLIDFKDKFNNIRLNALGDTLFFSSKIFVGYGIYQTISAFRKYGK